MSTGAAARRYPAGTPEPGTRVYEYVRRGAGEPSGLRQQLAPAGWGPGCCCLSCMAITRVVK
eukprot:SAG31_NODE_4471_length_3205_cov_2.753059_3_plen_62_part_00